MQNGFAPAVILLLIDMRSLLSQHFFLLAVRAVTMAERLRQLAAHLGYRPGPRIARAASTAESADTVIRDALIVDGSGAAAQVGDLAVRDGLIVHVGGRYQGPPAREEMDGRGKVLAPGFIDIHT